MSIDDTEYEYIANRNKDPVKPEKATAREISSGWHFRCPLCHDPLDINQKECAWCTVKIDWSEFDKDGEQE